MVEPEENRDGAEEQEYDDGNRSNNEGSNEEEELGKENGADEMLRVQRNPGRQQQPPARHEIFA